MFNFLVYEDGRPAEHWPLNNAHLVGVDDVGVRSSIRYEPGQIVVEKAATGSAALALQFEMEGLGQLLLQTCLLPDRAKPYILTVELARHRIMKSIAKQEDWAMFDIDDNNSAKQHMDQAKLTFFEALDAQDEPAKADALARKSLALAIQASEELSLTHAEVLLERRKHNHTLAKYAFGCGVSLEQSPDDLGDAVKENSDYLLLPTPWRLIEPNEQEFQWDAMDAWCEWAVKHRIPIIVGPLLSFAPDFVPDWMYVWEHDFDSVRDLVYEHIETMVSRYRNVVSLWNVASGVHVNRQFAFNFEQVMDLTRMAVMHTKQTNPSARTLIEIVQPFGEYYAFSQRSIPPIMFAEMVVQAGIPFDAFGLRVVQGQAADGKWTRDLLQLSSILDRFNGLGKPVHLTAVGVPSGLPPEADPDATSIGLAPPGASGYWHKPWSEKVQADWLDQFYRIAMSKPFVESVSWLDIADHHNAELINGGLHDVDGNAKPALKSLSHFRQSLHASH